MNVNRVWPSYVGGIGTGPGVIHVDNFSKPSQQGGRQRTGQLNAGWLLLSLGFYAIHLLYNYFAASIHSGNM
jgi:hypothetical protein